MVLNLFKSSNGSISGTAQSVIDLAGWLVGWWRGNWARAASTRGWWVESGVEVIDWLFVPPTKEGGCPSLSTGSPARQRLLGGRRVGDLHGAGPAGQARRAGAGPAPAALAALPALAAGRRAALLPRAAARPELAAQRLRAHRTSQSRWVEMRPTALYSNLFPFISTLGSTMVAFGTSHFFNAFHQIVKMSKIPNCTDRQFDDHRVRKSLKLLNQSKLNLFLLLKHKNIFFIKQTKFVLFWRWAFLILIVSYMRFVNWISNTCIQ